jgi:hypothetical protein
MMHRSRAMMVPVCAVLVLVLTAPARPEAPVAPEASPVAPEMAPVAPEAAPVAPEMAPVAPPAAPQDPRAKYQIILERNIFSRQRGPVRRPGEDRDTGPVKLPDPETHFVLKGIVQEDNEFIAFIEDTQAGTVLRLRKDDHVARGVIKALNLDGIEYQFQEQTTAVKLGYDLQGNLGPVSVRVSVPVPVAPAAPAPPGAATGPAAPAPGVTSAPTGQPAAPAGDEADILRRLMEQRRQQLGQ